MISGMVKTGLTGLCYIDDASKRLDCRRETRTVTWQNKTSTAWTWVAFLMVALRAFSKHLHLNFPTLERGKVLPSLGFHFKVICEYKNVLRPSYAMGTWSCL